ncbi:hypothetical protein BKA82DRAFT_1006017 [Pisolithus tinctorius]|uniref:Uncharacterized protein n=1 Tax=Pisolithus tinctorius Marx 270 TaxID=870435 RepID=A0A0C3NQ96_PISTI|nr:hypothetical protein BKA82DRAFT_1006017 [Pisolithus tinctorius]KIN97478.1 hypothetical protein M404DRAFT_1006017 [Pisolithus tinctorius Marx 270]
MEYACMGNSVTAHLLVTRKLCPPPSHILIGRNWKCPAFSNSDLLAAGTSRYSDLQMCLGLSSDAVWDCGLGHLVMKPYGHISLSIFLDIHKINGTHAQDILTPARGSLHACLYPQR